MPTPPTRVNVLTASRRYDALIAPGLLNRAGELLRPLFAPECDRCAVIADTGVRDRFLPPLIASLQAAGFRASTFEVQPSEPAKSLLTLDRILTHLAEHRHERAHPVLALGGGIVGDTAGFAAACYRRGVPWVNCPTTLLSMVDASVGGKTGVNLPAAGALKKNMVGAFWQPALVLTDVSVLDTLPERALRSGLAECVKHALLSADFADPDLFDWTSNSIPNILARDPRTLQELVARNIAVKARVVQTDEREEAPDDAAGRALLNLGHTFGHAIETLPGLSPSTSPSETPLQHGEAIALGLCAACHLAAALDRIPASLHLKVVALLESIGLPTRVEGLPDSPRILSLMRDDKKVLAGRLRLILPRDAGRCEVVSDPDQRLVLSAIDSIRA